MSLSLKEVRNPVPRQRASKILAALLAGGDHNEYSAAGAIAPSDSIALLRPSVAGMAMTLADGTTIGETIRVEMIEQDSPTFTAVLTPANFADGTTMTFDGVGQYEVLIWNGTAWKQRTGNSTIA